MKILLTSLSLLIAGVSFGQDFTIDTENAKVKFEYVDDETKGSIPDITAKIVIATVDSLTTATVEGSANVASLTTGNTSRDKHLKSSDFFDAAKFPTMTFSCTEFFTKDDKQYARGTLKIKGVEKTVKFRVKTDETNMKFYASIYALDYGVVKKKDRKATKVRIQVIVPLN